MVPAARQPQKPWPPSSVTPLMWGLQACRAKAGHPAATPQPARARASCWLLGRLLPHLLGRVLLLLVAAEVGARRGVAVAAHLVGTHAHHLGMHSGRHAVVHLQCSEWGAPRSANSNEKGCVYVRWWWTARRAGGCATQRRCAGMQSPLRAECVLLHCLLTGRSSHAHSVLLVHALQTIIPHVLLQRCPAARPPDAPACACLLTPCGRSSAGHSRHTRRRPGYRGWRKHPRCCAQ